MERKSHLQQVACRSAKRPTASPKRIKENSSQEFVIKLRRRLPRPWLVSVSVTSLMLWEAPLAWHGPLKLFLEMALGKVKEARGLQEMVSRHWGVIIWTFPVAPRCGPARRRHLVPSHSQPSVAAWLGFCHITLTRRHCCLFKSLAHFHIIAPSRLTRYVDDTVLSHTLPPPTSFPPFRRPHDAAR